MLPGQITGVFSEFPFGVQTNFSAFGSILNSGGRGYHCSPCYWTNRAIATANGYSIYGTPYGTWLNTSSNPEKYVYNSLTSINSPQTCNVPYSYVMLGAFATSKLAYSGYNLTGFPVKCIWPCILIGAWGSVALDTQNKREPGVFTETDPMGRSAPQTHLVNGVRWYYNDLQSMGFVHNQSKVNLINGQDECGFVTEYMNGNVDYMGNNMCGNSTRNYFTDYRLSWTMNALDKSGGYRAGRINELAYSGLGRAPGIYKIAYSCTISPTSQPSSQPSSDPTQQPSTQPSLQPTSQPSSDPTQQPSSQPTGDPTQQPTSKPTRQPSVQPTRRPSAQPSGQPSRQPSSQPSAQPFSQPSAEPSKQPTSHPSSQPSVRPSVQPTRRPSAQPSGQPSRQPSSQPSAQPSSQPSSEPSKQPTSHPSSQPSVQPSALPTRQPIGQPTAHPSTQPTSRPSVRPTSLPSGQPSMQPTSYPSCIPSSQPSSQPSTQPYSKPSGAPSLQPSLQPSGEPTVKPTTTPTTGIPRARPTGHPSGQPSAQPLAVPTTMPTFPQGLGGHTWVPRNYYSMAIKSATGSVFVWGDPNMGGNASTSGGGLLSSGVQRVFGNKYSYAAITADNRVVAWGEINNAANIRTASRLRSVTKLWGNDGAFAALNSTGGVAAFGNPAYGGDLTTVPAAVRLLLSRGVSDVVSNTKAFAAIRDDGTVVTWGNPRAGGAVSAVPLTGPGTSGYTIIPGLSNVRSIYANRMAFVAVAYDRRAIGWGSDLYGGSITVPHYVQTVCATTGAFAVVSSNRRVTAWGAAELGGNSSHVAHLLGNTQAVYATDSAFAALSYDGTVVVWGNKYAGGEYSAGVQRLSGIVSITASGGAFAALNVNGTVSAWGEWDSGGCPSFASVCTSGGPFGAWPNYLPFGTRKDIVSIASTWRAFAALDRNGNVHTWGNSFDGGAQPPALPKILQLCSNHVSFTVITNTSNGDPGNSVYTWGRTYLPGYVSGYPSGLYPGMVRQTFLSC